MSVFTPVTEDQVHIWLKNYALGRLIRLEGIAAGIENTNFFLTTTQGEYVLTLFEKLSMTQLPYYIRLMSHLARCGIPCPAPVARMDSEYLSLLNGKPACVVTKLPGRSVLAPSITHCTEVGRLLAKIHRAGTSYDLRMDNWRGLNWWKQFAPKITELLPKDESHLLSSELAFHNRLNYWSLPQGVIHGDLFRDNALFVGDRIEGVIDFYFACNEIFLFDLAVTVNDWCANTEAILDNTLADSLVAAYHSVRALTAHEQQIWPIILRAAAFRSWLGRLEYTYFPQPGEITHTKDHGHFRRLLEHHIGNTYSLHI